MTREAIYQACLVAAKAMEPRLKTMSWFARNAQLPPPDLS